MTTVTLEGRGSRRRIARYGALALGLALSGCAATTHAPGTPPPSGVQLVALQEDHDFGTVESGPVVAHTFRLKNLGPDVIDITSVTPACGCTAVLASTPRLAPGEEGGVEVALDTYKLSGAQAKTVTVRSSDVVRPELVLTVHGTVATDLKAAPSRVYMGRLPAGAVVSQHVDVETRPDVEITSVSSESNRLQVQTTPLDPPQHGVRVRVTLLPTATTGTFDDRIVVSSTSPRQPKVTIPVLGTIESQQQYARHRGGDTASR
jgi:Protein of unknown function (DUF1573)